MTDMQIRIIRAIQGGIPLANEPFREIAHRAGVSDDELVAQLQAWKEEGVIRRFGAILSHRQAGYAVNAMGVWNVPDERIEEFGRIASASSAVSHCYQRPRFEGFNYNVYTMIHGRTKDECESTARAIFRDTGISDYELLYTVREFKKSPPVYFRENGKCFTGIKR